VTEANKRLEAIKARQIKDNPPASENGSAPLNQEMKIEFNQSKKDSALFSNEPEIKAVPTTTNSEQPK